MTKKYIVWETYAFGVNYINQAGQFIPDYTCENCPPCVDYNFLRVLLDRYNDLQYREVNNLKRGLLCAF